MAAVRSGMIIVAITLGMGAIGLFCGEAIGYAIAWATQRDPGELKDVLVWCFLTTPLIFAAAGFWLSVRMLTERLWIKRLALTIFLTVALCSAALILLTYLDAPRYN